MHFAICANRGKTSPKPVYHYRYFKILGKQVQVKDLQYHPQTLPIYTYSKLIHLFIINYLNHYHDACLILVSISDVLKNPKIFHDFDQYVKWTQSFAMPLYFFWWICDFFFPLKFQTLLWAYSIYGNLNKFAHNDHIGENSMPD